MTYHWVIPLIAAIAVLVLAAVVSRRGPGAELSQAFTFLAVVLVFWNLNFFVLYSVADKSVAFALSRFFRAGIMFLPVVILHLFLALRPREGRLWRVALAADYVACVLLMLLNALDLLIADVRRVPWGYASVGTPLLNWFTTLLAVNAAGGLALLLYDYRTCQEPRMRLQLRLWLIGALVAIPLGITNLLPAYGIPVYPLGNLGTAAWAGIVAYAIVRHRLMDIDLVVTKGMAYAAVAFALIAPAFGLVLWLQRLSFGLIHPDFSFAVLVLFVLVGVLFPTIRFRAESRISRSLFREKHEYRAALAAFARSIVRIFDRERLVRELAVTLSDTLQLHCIAVVLFDQTKHAFTVHHAIGNPLSAQEFGRGDQFICALGRCHDAVLLDELIEAATPAERAAVSRTCQSNGWQVCIPLTVSGSLMGFISLGGKRNLDAFFAEDLELLGTLAAEASVALENARLYEELKKSQDIIRRADRLSALGTLAAGIAHEVRNPLVSIQTFFQLAPDRLHDEEFLTTFLSMTSKEVTRISDLITELLSFARSPTRSLGPISLNDAVDRVVTLLEPEARKHNLALARELSDAVPLVRADSDQVKQVLINLILNAIQATQPGGVVTVSTRTVQHLNVIAGQFVVSDTGAGIPQDQLDHVFDPFFTTKDKGTGLGLAIVHQIIVEHGGSISVDSKPGVGTTFFVDLPPAEPVESSNDAPEVSNGAAVVPLRYERPRKVAS